MGENGTERMNQLSFTFPPPTVSHYEIVTYFGHENEVALHCILCAHYIYLTLEFLLYINTFIQSIYYFLIVKIIGLSWLG